MRERAGLIALAGLFATTIACGGGVDFDVAVKTAEPASGPLAGGQTVVITGEGFLEGGAQPTLVLIGDNLAPSAVVLSDRQVQVTTPPGLAPGPVDVVVFNDHGFGVASGIYTYNPATTVTAVVPGHGPTAGGTTVTISGSGFSSGTAGTNRVFIDGVLADPGSVEVVSDTELRVSTPPRAGFAMVDVTVDNGNGAATLPRGFGYLDPGLVFTRQDNINNLFGGSAGPARLVHLDPATGVTSNLGTIAFQVTSLLHVGGGRFLAGGSSGTPDGSLFEVDLDGRASRVGTLSFRRPKSLATHGGTVFAFLWDNGRNASSLGTLNRATGEYAELAVPINNRSCIASDGVRLLGISTLPDTSGLSIFAINPATGEPVPGSAVSVPTLGNCRGMASFAGTFYLAGNSNLGSGLHSIDPATGEQLLKLGDNEQIRALAAVE
jgi:hypothetical protein